ncbi:relaxase/mobilization nuclease domain-containing protein [Rhodocytophaga aerolata]|uniref:Relaxase/mobilization nuclease domain-containing protein n=1 Tax=Rhodocytophaga aerolata TaxID=455078 RepID=A0ABT8RJ54_9BACT|nr:relaxase/mobilization nuclease domain-containing protein [Rhodocytophaga aerolata]MDO1451796.1 relaxase/mobilization nuclease domain-containing protein [Rhodocytophaga aerolata]
MIAKISTAKSIKAVIDYNEKKVEKGEGRIIGGDNMRNSTDIDKLSYEKKLSRFEQMITRKQNTQHEKVAFHASLSLDPTEKPTDETLKAIASAYMKHMGYGGQPYLIYRHEDTHHPHIHIVSTSVDRDGKKINDSNNRYRSEDIRKAIE